LPEITQSTGVSYGSVVDPRDPVTPNVARGVTNLTTANPNLQPERSRNLNFGVVLSPNAQTSLGIDYFEIRQKGLIDTEDAAYVIKNEDRLPGRIVRDEQGRILSIARQFSNQGDRWVSGFDLDLSRHFSLGALGDLKLRGQISRMLQFKASPALGEPAINGAGSNQFGSIPSWRSNTTATWQLGALTSTLNWNYVGSYAQTYLPSDAAAKSVEGYSVFDLNLDYQVTPKLLATVSIQNLTNRQLPWDGAYGGFDSSQGDPRGRFLSLKAHYQF